MINYGRPLPPVERRWKKGQSGNPNGRPKKTGNIVDLLNELVNALCPTDPERRSYAELIARSMVHQALKGHLGAAKEILNRLAGRVPFLIERVGRVAGEDDREPGPESNPAAQANKLSLKTKNEILEIFGIEPLSE